ncbi:MAG: hypothetical protein R2724_16250 [Bryobacterales bacterium]
MKTRVLLALVIVANAAGNLMLGYGMRQVGDISSYSPVALAASGLAAMANPWVLAGVVLLTVFFAAHAIVLSWADLSYVVLVTAIGYGLVTLLSWALLGEHVSVARWAGVAIITLGVMLAGSTPDSTVKQ